MKKSKIFYIIGGLSFVPVAVGIGLMGAFAQNYNDYNILKKQNDSISKYWREDLKKEMSNNTQESLFHNTLSMHIGELINLNEKDKELKKKKNDDFYKLAKNTPNVNKNILEAIKLQSELNYVFPKKDEFISGTIIFSISLAAAISLLSLGLAFGKREKLEKQNNLENNLPQNQE